jgi:hypothetical protein
MEAIVYEKMRSSKDRNKGSFKDWLLDILSFSKEQSSLIKAFPKWESLMKNPDIYLEYKANAHEILKYSSKKYIYFYNKECMNPKELTDLTRTALDHVRIVDYFNMNFFNLEDPKVVLLGFIEGLNQACKKIDLDVTEVMVRFFRIYFYTQDFTEERKYGPIKTRFVELHRNMTGNLVTSNPDGTLNVSKSFYDRLNPSESKAVKTHLDNGIKPENEDYVEVMKVIQSYELKYHKEDTSVIWTHLNFSLIRSKKRKNVYLIDSTTGIVLKVFDIQIPISTIISKSEEIVR